MGNTDFLSGEGVRELLSDAQSAGIRYIDETGSTNDVLRELAVSGAPELTAVIASRQTAGRGRMGRRFHSPGDTGVYMSLLFRPSDAGVLALMTPMAAVAVSRALDMAFGTCAGIKWVNDVLVRGKKVCGILAETVPDDRSGVCAVVVGIGINIYEPEGGFPADMRNKAGAVLECVRPGAKNAAAAAVIEEFSRLYRSRDRDELLREYRRRCIVPGREVTVVSPSGERAAEALRIEEDFRLRVRYSDGTEESLSSGEVSIKGLY